MMMVSVFLCFSLMVFGEESVVLKFLEHGKIELWQAKSKFLGL